jgi:branched-subunit amino acid ABC-type transport system permease component
VLVIAPLIGIGLDRAIMRHLQGKELVVQLLVTVGLMFAFIGLANLIWDQNLSHTLPPLFGNGGFHVAGVVMTWARTFTIVLAVALAVGLRILLFRTRLGVSMRAVVDNRGLASLAGARSELVSSFSWALGCSLAALAGILLAPINQVTISLGTDFILEAFAVVLVGGLGSMTGAVVAALVIGIVQSFLTIDYPPLSGYGIYLVMVIVLVFRPSGLFKTANAALGAENV